MQLEIGVDALLLVGSGLLLLAGLASAVLDKAGARFRVPGALLFLGLGMLAGNDGLGLVLLDDPQLVQNVGTVALLFILFEGGLTTKPTDLRLAALPGALLATIGVAVTAGITGLGIWLVLDLDPVTSLLLGAVVASTDAAAVFSMMRTTPLPRRISALLRIESGANDPIAVMLTVGLLATLAGDEVTAGDWAVFALVQLLGGALVGLAVGGIGVATLRRLDLGVEGMYPVVAGALGALAYSSAAWAGASGFVAVYFAGLLVGALVPRHRRSIRGVHEALANAAEIGLFLLLGLLVTPSELPPVALPGLLVALLLAVVARPVAVWLCTLGQRFSWRERALVSWGGLRGAVPIVLATFPATAAADDAGAIFNVVFFVVLVSVLVQGTTLRPLVRGLRLQVDRPAWAPVAEALPIEGLDVDLVEVFVTEDLALHGRRLHEVPPPDRALVAAIVRGHRVLIPRGDTRLATGDVLLLTTHRQGDVLTRMTAWARGEVPTTGGSTALGHTGDPVTADDDPAAPGAAGPATAHPGTDDDER
ncbi:potassium/proton antiporter [Egicoccus halophilus]|uniref:K+/H+ antiporter n=1 Tax=Egicoccus halophilus TaxID=1670830 RepID=A0A8J3ABC2_9ACTN|nr:potassium/proton antiporter [Egicoccus halophilus]GGI07309.1 K+/H+ antiporter [Egicoccus halophilus]